MKRDIFIRDLKTQVINDNLAKNVVINMITASLTAVVFSEFIREKGIFIFLSLILLINLCRIPYIYLVKKDRLDQYSLKAKVWSRGTLIFSTLNWSLVILTLFPLLEIYHYFIFLIIIQILATGGMLSLSARLFLSLIHVNLLMLPLIYIIFQNNSLSPDMYLTPVAIIYYLFLTFWALAICRQVETNLHLKLSHKISLEKSYFSEKRFETIFEEAPTGIFYYNLDLVIKNSNISFTKLLEVEPGSLNGFDMNKLPDKRLFPTLSKVCKNEKGSYEGAYLTAHSKKELWISLRTSPVFGPDGELIGGVGIVEDLTERIRIQNRIEYQAYHDNLTDLPNRQLLLDRLEQALKSVQRHGHLGCLLFLDLDKFKLINDTMGHRMGDLLLIEVSKRLKHLLREEDTVARLGGDEFIVLLPNLDISAEKAVEYTDLVCSKIHDTLSKPILLDSQNIQTSASIGVYVFNSEDFSAEHILKSADTAMYDAKDKGRNRSSYYHTGMEENLKQRMILEVELKEALKNNELSIYFQPIVEVKNEQIMAAESLLRWNHSSKGFISPEDIINAAESSNQILVLGNWIVKQVLKQFREWLDQGIDQLQYVSINISMKQILQPGFAADMMRHIRESGVPPEKIVLEITESILISDFDMTVAKIRSLRKEGVQFALDDFGTGYSSLSYLKRLPVDKLKIDRYFTRTLLTNHDDYVLIKTILSISDYFDLSVIAEGVEEKAQVEKLMEMGCSFYQGYFCSKPLAPDDFIKGLSERRF